MCYERKDRGLDEEARRLKAEEDWRRRAKSETGPADNERDKALTEKVKETVGAR